jgi:hypothetical protein
MKGKRPGSPGELRLKVVTVWMKGNWKVGRFGGVVAEKGSIARFTGGSRVAELGDKVSGWDEHKRTRSTTAEVFSRVK